MQRQETDPIPHEPAEPGDGAKEITDRLTLVYVRCDEVVVTERHRRKLPRIDSLSASVKRIGLLQPIAITFPEKRLIIGERRLTAAIQAGEECIAAVVVRGLSDQYELLLAEVMENSEREQPAYSDLADLAEDLLPLAQEAAKNRQSHQDADPELRESFSEAGNALDHVAEIIKLSRPTLNKVRKIVAAAREDRAQFGDLVERMDVDRKVDGAYKELLRRQGLLKEKPREPDEIEGVSLRTDKKGNFNISISADRRDMIAVLKTFLNGLRAAQPVSK